MLRRCKRISEDGKRDRLIQAAPNGMWTRSPEAKKSFLKRPKGVLHVLQQLSIVSFNLSFTILHRVLNRKR